MIRAYFPRNLTWEVMMRRSFSTTIAVACLLSAPVAAAKTEAASWGKPGVSIDQYRTDAITCGRAGYYADVSNTQAAKVFRRATNDLEANETDLSLISMDPSPSAGAMLATIVTRSAMIVEGTHADAQIKDVGALMQAKVDDCLRNRGYVHFRLTDSQRKHLAHLHLGSAERHIYLYQLGTDPAVLTAQAM